MRLLCTRKSLARTLNSNLNSNPKLKEDYRVHVSGTEESIRVRVRVRVRVKCRFRIRLGLGLAIGLGLPRTRKWH